MSWRRSGILLHPTSLPGDGGVGDLGSTAYRFVDFIVQARQQLWQILPLGPVGSGGSPYDARSSFAGNPLLIGFERLIERGLLTPADLEDAPVFSPEEVDYPVVESWKDTVLRRAYERFRQGTVDETIWETFTQFTERESYWLNDYALYQALRLQHQERPWYEWEQSLAKRDRHALAAAAAHQRAEIDYQRFVQYLFQNQWDTLKAYAAGRGVAIIGDVPIYVSHDSADVWANQSIFTVDERGLVTAMAGVPPDLFSSTGQLWGNPCYRWDVLAGTHYEWWVRRFRRTLQLVDIARVDHFRAFASGWQVPAGAETAIDGQWVPGPGLAFFEAVREQLGDLPLIVEDLGTITPDVEELRDRLGFPGMKVLQFAFGGGSDNPYLPHQHIPNAVVYTGTHDNDTSVGWFESLAGSARSHLLRYTASQGHDVHWTLIRLALSSVASLAVIPLQDILGLGSEARMNFPGRSEGNWRWRARASDLRLDVARRLADLTDLYGRASPAPDATCDGTSDDPQSLRRSPLR